MVTSQQKLMMHIIEKLERSVQYYRLQLANNHKKQRRESKRLPSYNNYWDLPMMASACCFVYSYGKGSFSDIKEDHSKPVRVDSYDSVPALKSKLLECSNQKNPKIGDKSKFAGCGNSVGRCAEPHAAKKCLLAIKHPDGPLDSLLFSLACEIKTGEPRNPCANCQHVFPHIKVFPKLKL